MSRLSPTGSPICSAQPAPAARKSWPQLSVWHGSLDVEPAVLEHFWQSLSPDERLRAERFRFAVHRDRFIAGRGLLRLRLGESLGRAGESLRFTCNPFGRPELVDSDLCFNVAHSGNEILIAISDGPVGVDLEEFRVIPDLDLLAQQVFSQPELLAWAEIAPELRVHRFLSLWTRKEALLKGLGAGITQHLKEVSVFFDNGACIVVPRALGTDRWMIETGFDHEMMWSVAKRV